MVGQVRPLGRSQSEKAAFSFSRLLLVVRWTGLPLSSSSPARKVLRSASAFRVLASMAPAGAERATKPNPNSLKVSLPGGRGVPNGKPDRSRAQRPKASGPSPGKPRVESNRREAVKARNGTEAQRLSSDLVLRVAS